LFFLAEEEFFLLLPVVFDARRLDDDDDDVNREDAVSADIVIVAKTYSIGPPWIYVSDVSSEKARFENSPLLGSRARAADSAGGEQILLQKKMIEGARFLDFFFALKNATTIAAGARVILALCCCLQKSCTDLASSRRRSKLTSTTN